jgi:hypothetical protein
MPWEPSKDAQVIDKSLPTVSPQERGLVPNLEHAATNRCCIADGKMSIFRIKVERAFSKSDTKIKTIDLSMPMILMPPPAAPFWQYSWHGMRMVLLARPLALVQALPGSHTPQALSRIPVANFWLQCVPLSNAMAVSWVPTERFLWSAGTDERGTGVHSHDQRPDQEKITL